MCNMNCSQALLIVVAFCFLHEDCYQGALFARKQHVILVYFFMMSSFLRHILDTNEQYKCNHLSMQVIGEPVYIAGNSLGGFVALYFAACNPHLVKGVTLLNATPFWGFLPNPTRSPRLSKIFPSAGSFPLPPTVRKLTEIV